MRILILSIFFVAFFACDKKKCINQADPECENYDPCLNVKVVEASFKIYEKLDATIFAADSVWCNNPIVLWTKNQNNSTVKWRIYSEGYSVTAKDTFVIIYPFAPPMMPTAKMYTVTLIVNRNTNDCPDAKATDSTSRCFYLWPKEHSGNFLPPCNYLPIFGTYKGVKASNPDKTVYVTIFDTIKPAANLPCNGDAAGKNYQWNIIRNLAYDQFGTENFGDAVSSDIKRKGASGFLLQSDNRYPNNGCFGSKFLISYRGYGQLDQKNKKKILINYSYRDTATFLWHNDVFIGERIN